MSDAKQIERLLTANLMLPQKELGELAEKIAALTDDSRMLAAAAAVENEVTSTLLDMLAATVLVTLIEEEGGGRSNVSYSPMSMDHMMKHYTYSVANDGMVRTVSIAMREDSDLRDPDLWRAPSNRHGVMHQDEDGSGAQSQAEPKVRDRPIWAVSFFQEGAAGPTLLNCHDQADAARQCRTLDPGLLPEVQNRHCLHPTCPSSRCNLWKDDDERPGNGMNPDGN